MGVIYICSHENNVPSQLSPRWFCGNSCTYTHDVHNVHVSKRLCCHKATVMIPRKANCFYDCIYIYLYIYIYILYIILYYSIPYKKLAGVGFEPTPSYLPYTRCNYWAIWPNDEMCLLVYRIKWPWRPSHH